VHAMPMNRDTFSCQIVLHIEDDSLVLMDYSWLNTSKSYAGELFRSVLPKHFTEEHFNTATVCCPLIEDPHELD